MRKGVADIHRRAQVSNAANERYLEALATVEDKTPMKDIIQDVQKRTTLHGQPIRALRVWDEDEVRLLQAVGAGEFASMAFAIATSFESCSPPSGQNASGRSEPLTSPDDSESSVLTGSSRRCAERIATWSPKTAAASSP
jgi:hypothetical protein